MDDCVVLYIYSIVKHLLPYDVAILGWVGTDNVQKFLDIDGLQLVVVSRHVPLPHEGCDVRIALPIKGHNMTVSGYFEMFVPPTFEIHLISTKMQILLREDLCDLLKESINKGVHSFLCGIHGPVVAVLVAHVIVALRQQAWLAGLEGLGVSGGVELRDHSDPAEPRVLDDVRHVLLGVHGDLLMPSSLLTEIPSWNQIFPLHCFSLIFCFV